MGLAILGFGTALPRQSITQQEAAELAKTFSGLPGAETGRLSTLYERTEIQTRGSVLLEAPDGSGPRQSFFPPAEDRTDRGPSTGQRMRRYAQEAVPLALAASRRALRAARLTGSQISHLITVSCTGFVAPGVDITLMKALQLAPTASRTHVGFMGCHGALNGLRVASALAHADPGARVLLCAVELCSLHFSYGGDPGKVVANALFADGAAALVAGSVPPAPTDAWRLAAAGSRLFPDSEDAMTWRIGDHGFEMTISPCIPDLIANHLPSWLTAWLIQQGVTVPQVRSWAIHPGGPRILTGVTASLDLSPEATAISREVLAECGNMSSPTILFILERLCHRRAPRPCVALAFGPGLSVEAALFV
ncbi:MAG: type III polyketide synthase [Candidatus Omnitrophica bacterium]|nr:type III polyketide synthase [Candidatus Omnitrophota bacterium]